MKNLEIVYVENENDLKECLKIRNEVFIKEKNVPKEIEVDYYDILNEICNHFLIKYEDKNIGTFRCVYEDDNTIKLQRFCLIKEFRNLGIGKKSLNYIENYYKSKNLKYITLNSKYNVSKFYEKCGYKKISKTFIEANVKHIKMKKNII